MNAEELLTQALARVESKSIQAWVKSEHNHPLWLKIAAGALEKNPKSSPCDFASYIVITAIGL